MARNWKSSDILVLILVYFWQDVFSAVIRKHRHTTKHTQTHTNIHTHTQAHTSFVKPLTLTATIPTNLLTLNLETTLTLIQTCEAVKTSQNVLVLLVFFTRISILVLSMYRLKGHTHTQSHPFPLIKPRLLPLSMG